MSKLWALTHVSIHCQWPDKSGRSRRHFGGLSIGQLSLQSNAFSYDLLTVRVFHAFLSLGLVSEARWTLFCIDKMQRKRNWLSYSFALLTSSRLSFWSHMSLRGRIALQTIWENIKWQCEIAAWLYLLIRIYIKPLIVDILPYFVVISRRFIFKVNKPNKI